MTCFALTLHSRLTAERHVSSDHRPHSVSLSVSGWLCFCHSLSVCPGGSGGRIFYSTFNFVCWLLFGARSTPVLPQWHVKETGHFPSRPRGRGATDQRCHSRGVKHKADLLMVIYQPWTSEEPAINTTKESVQYHMRWHAVSETILVAKTCFFVCAKFNKCLCRV